MKAAKESNKMDLADVMKVDCVQCTANIVVNNTAGMSGKSMQWHGKSENPESARVIQYLFGSKS